MTFGSFAAADREPTRKMAGDETCFFFHYSAGDQNLLEHEWKNASRIGAETTETSAAANA
jgi:hypothetical protein